MKSILVVLLMTSSNCFANTYVCQALVNSQDPKQTGIAVVDDSKGLFRAATNDGQDNEIISADTVTPYGWRWLQWDRNQECQSTSKKLSNATQISFLCNSAQGVGINSMLEISAANKAGKYSGTIISPPNPDLEFSVEFKDCTLKN